MQTSHKILLIFLGFFFTNLRGQDIHFSQYFNSPLSLNPAHTGNFDGDWRAFANYRNQWKAIAYPFRTFSGGYDQHLYIDKHHLSIGGYVLNDQSGQVALKANKVYLSGAYHKDINHNHFIGALQVGYIMKSIRYDELLFPDDWNDSYRIWDPNYGSSAGDRDQLSYLDINLGFSWSKQIRDYDVEAGLAFFHVNQPKETFYGSNTSKIPMRIAFQTAIRKALSPTLFVKPGVLFYTMRSSRNMMIGGQTGFTMKSNRLSVREVYGGLYLRNGIADPADAVMVMFGAQIRKFTLNVSYDVNISSMRSYTNYRGAFEVSLIYKSITTIVKTFTIPCERI